jgi:hypothetical protein
MASRSPAASGGNFQRSHPPVQPAALEGSFIPFAKSRTEREKTADPRPSLEERYGDHAGFVAAIRTAASRLVAARFMLEADAAAWIETAEQSDVLSS